MCHFSVRELAAIAIALDEEEGERKKLLVHPMLRDRKSVPLLSTCHPAQNMSSFGNDLSATEEKMESTPSAHGHAQAQPSAQNIF